jgi:cytochrome oxidase Cu insertion factor (SCO1/SenC/PrrC family)
VATRKTKWLLGLGIFVVALIVLVTLPPSFSPFNQAVEMEGTTEGRLDVAELGRKPVKYGSPDFTVETFEGESFRLARQRGTPVVLNFWESW